MSDVVGNHEDPFSQNEADIGNISRESCKSCKQTSAHARVCLQDLQVPREIFPVFLIKGRLIYILHSQKCPFLPFMKS